MSELGSLRAQIAEVKKKAADAEAEGYMERFDTYLRLLASLSEKEVLLMKEEQGVAVASNSSAGTAGGGADIRAIAQEAGREAAKEVLKQLEAGPVSKAFNRVGSTEAEHLLIDLNLREVDGNEELPISTAGIEECSAFDYFVHANENAGTPALLRHHQEHLAKLGVPFGRGGFQVYDLHKNTKLYSITSSSGQKYSGGIDGCISPFGMRSISAACEARVVYEHRRSSEQGDTSAQGASSSSREGLAFSAGEKGQAITALLAAYAYNNYPLLVDLTDGKVHHVMQVKGDLLYSWTDLSPTQAYALQKQVLLSDSNLTAKFLQAEAIPEELRGPPKKLRSALRPSAASGLIEQLDSLVPHLQPDERVIAALELIGAWPLQSSELPEAVRMLYA